jgi:hypothetical protein
MILHRVMGTMSATEVLKHPRRPRPWATKAPASHHAENPWGSNGAEGRVNTEGVQLTLEATRRGHHGGGHMSRPDRSSIKCLRVVKYL